MRELKAAETRFKIVHHKEPRELIKPATGTRWAWPREWALSGVATRVYYASDRGDEDGRITLYFHDHEHAIRMYEPLGLRPWAEPETPEAKLPSVLTCIGQALGIDMKRPNGKKQFVKCDRHDWITTNAAGNILVFIDPTSGAYVLLEGSGLSVGPHGIEG